MTKAYLNFFSKKQLYQRVDKDKVKKWTDKKISDEIEKNKKINEKIEKYEEKVESILNIIMSVFIVIILIRPHIYWALKLICVVTFVIFATIYFPLFISSRIVKNVLEKNEKIINLEKNRRLISSRNYNSIIKIDSPELCAILVKAVDPIIDYICDTDKGMSVYNVYAGGRRYRFEQNEKIENAIKTI